LLGTEGLATDHYLAAGEPVLSTLGYYMYAGRHSILPPDWRVFLTFMRKHLLSQH
jgi:hypothetical protein